MRKTTYNVRIVLATGNFVDRQYTAKTAKQAIAYALARQAGAKLVSCNIAR